MVRQLNAKTLECYPARVNSRHRTSAKKAEIQNISRAEGGLRTKSPDREDSNKAGLPRPYLGDYA
jgi:hypothetical protein